MAAYPQLGLKMWVQAGRGRHEDRSRHVVEIMQVQRRLPGGRAEDDSYGEAGPSSDHMPAEVDAAASLPVVEVDLQRGPDLGREEARVQRQDRDISKGQIQGVAFAR